MKAQTVSDHVLEIDVMFFKNTATPIHANDGVHKWRAVCTCGFQSEWSMSPKTAERELEFHRRKHPRTAVEREP